MRRGVDLCLGTFCCVSCCYGLMLLTSGVLDSVVLGCVAMVEGSAGLAFVAFLCFVPLGSVVVCWLLNVPVTCRCI